MRYNTQVSGLGDDTTATTDTSGNWLSNLVQSFAQFKIAQGQIATAQQAQQINLQRQAQGLPPIAFDLSAGAPTVAVGLAPGTQQLLTYAVFGGLALFALSMVMKRA